MAIDPNAGKPAQPSMLVNVPRLVTAYYTGQPDPSVAAQRVTFGEVILAEVVETKLLPPAGQPEPATVTAG